MQDLFAAEGEELARQGGGAVAGLIDLADVALQRVFRLQSPQGQFAVAGDHGQQIVEVVRDAARELPDGFHLLRLPELLIFLRSRLSKRTFSIALAARFAAICIEVACSFV